MVPVKSGGDHRPFNKGLSDDTDVEDAPERWGEIGGGGGGGRRAGGGNGWEEGREGREGRGEGGEEGEEGGGEGGVGWVDNGGGGKGGLCTCRSPRAGGYECHAESSELQHINLLTHWVECVPSLPEWGAVSCCFCQTALVSLATGAGEAPPCYLRAKGEALGPDRRSRGSWGRGRGREGVLLDKVPGESCDYAVDSPSPEGRGGEGRGGERRGGGEWNLNYDQS